MIRAAISIFQVSILVLCFGASASGQEASTPRLPVISKSISVADAVSIALENNPRVLGGAAEAKVAAARARMARAETRPQVSTTTFATTGTMPNIVSGSPNVEPNAATLVPDDGQLDQNLMLMYPLYTGGRLRSQVRAAGAQHNAARSDAVTTRLDAALEAKTAYKRVLLARRYVEAYQRRVDESTERVRIAQAAFDEGKIAKFDLLRNQTELAEARQLLVNAQRDVDVAMVDLKSTIGISQTSQLTLTDQLTFAQAETSPEEAQARALAQRPEVKAVRSRLKAAESAVDGAKSAYRPQVYAVAMQDFVRQSGGGSDQGYTVGVTAALPIYDAGWRKSAVDEAKAMVDRVRAEEREVGLMVSRDVGTAWVEAQAAAKNVNLARTAVDQADEDYRVIKLRYEAGKSINVEVLDALASLTRAQTNYAQAVYEHSVAQDRLERAVGAIQERS